VLTPYGGSERYNLVIEDADGQFWRVQCKTGWFENGAIYFDTANHNVTGKKRDWRHYRGQCEYFAVYCPDLSRVYLVPIDQVGRTRAHLEIEPTKDNQEKNVRWARDYELSSLSCIVSRLRRNSFKSDRRIRYPPLRPNLTARSCFSRIHFRTVST
jgi:PD-(D/E)XK nuclease superfamily protein